MAWADLDCRVGCLERQESASLEDGSPAGELRVLTLNVWINEAPQRCHDQVLAVRTINPDIICLQEAFSTKVVKAFGDAFGTKYELIRFTSRLSIGATLAILIYSAIAFLVCWGLIAVIAVIIHALVCSVDSLARITAAAAALVSLPLTPFTLYKNPLGFADFLLGNKTGTLMLVRRDRVRDITAKATIFDELSYDYLNWLRPRGFLCVTGFLQGHGADLPFKVMTSHLDQVISQPEGHGRIAQAKQMMMELDEFEGLAVVAGDWNCTPANNPGGTKCGTYEFMASEMQDAWDGQSELGATWDQEENPLAMSKVNDAVYENIDKMRWRCDIIFWKNTSCAEVSLSSCEVVLQPPDMVSDHYGVVATFRW